MATKDAKWDFDGIESESRKVALEEIFFGEGWGWYSRLHLNQNWHLECPKLYTQLREFESASGFVGPCELIVITCSA